MSRGWWDNPRWSCSYTAQVTQRAPPALGRRVPDDKANCFDWRPSEIRVAQLLTIGAALTVPRHAGASLVTVLP